MRLVSGSAPRVQPLYFASGPIDFAVVGGVSLVACLVLWVFPTNVGTLPIALATICNWPHFAATSYRLYHSRENLRQYPLTAGLAPLVVLAAMIWALVSPARIAPAFVKLMLLWSPYHFSGQTLGLTLGYARRAGVTIDRRTRQALTVFLYASYLANTAALETGPGTRQFIGVAHARLGVAPWVTPAFDIVSVVAAVAFVVLLHRSARPRSVPPIILLPPLAQGVWFVWGRGVDSFQVLVPFFHSVQYMLVAWAVQLAERRSAQGAPPSVRFVATETARWWLLNVAFGLGLFVGLPYLYQAATGIELGVAMAVGAAAVQIHHFFVDGVIWKLRNSRIAAPLLVSVQEAMYSTPARDAA